MKSVTEAGSTLGDGSLESGIDRAVDLPHAAHINLRGHLVGSEARAGAKGHPLRRRFAGFTALHLTGPLVVVLTSRELRDSVRSASHNRVAAPAGA